MFAEKEHRPQSQQNSFQRGEFPVQTRLEIGSKDDPQEKEADAVADKVMRKSEAGGKTSGGGDEPVLRMQHEDYDSVKEDEEKVQKKE